MKVIIESEGVICTVEKEATGETFTELAELIRYASLGVGFGEKTVTDVIGSTF